MGKVERWDQIATEDREVTTARYQLTAHGSIPDLEQRIGRLGGQGEAEAGLRSIFRDPAAARAALEQSYGDVGRDLTYKRLAEHPEEFGKLRGQSIFGAVTEAREQSLNTAYNSGRLALGHRRRQEKLQAELEQAKVYHRRQTQLREEREGLTPASFDAEAKVRFGGYRPVERLQAQRTADRERLVADVGREARGLKLSQLKAHLTPEQYRLLEGIRRDEREHLQPLRMAIGKLKRAQTTGAQGLRLAKKVAGFYGLAPRHIVMRLLPREVQTAVAAVKLVWSLARSMDRGLGR